MRTDRRNGIVCAVHRVAVRPDGGVTDGQLLDRFITTRDEVAFAALVRRHGPMVLGVCRRVLGNAHDAEDAFQVTFLVLARKAASLTRRELVGNWLHGAAYRAALEAKAARRRVKERQVTALPEPAVTDEVGNDLWPVLDRELSRLPDRFRTAVVLCDLEGRARRDVARQLGVPEGTLSGRLTTGRRLLARRLARLGLAVPATAALSWGPAVAVPPTALVTSTIETGLGSVSGGVAGEVPPRIAALTESVLTAMSPSYLNHAAAAVILGLAVAVAGVYVPDSRAEKPADPKPAARAPEAGDKPKVKPGPTVPGRLVATDVGKKTVTVAVVTDPGSKKTEDKTFAVAADVEVVLEEGTDKKVPPPQGKLGELPAGTEVVLQLAADEKTVSQIRARGPDVRGTVKALDTGKGTITVAVKKTDGPEEMTFALGKGAKVLLNDGLSKEVKDQEGKLDELAEGTAVLVQASVDRKTAFGVRVMPQSILGTLKGVDSGTGMVTVTVKEDAQIVDKTYTLVKGAKVDDNLTAGARVLVQVSVFDKTKAVAVRERD